MLYIFTKSTIAAGGSRHRAFLVAEFLRRKSYEVSLIIPPAYRNDISRNKARIEYLKVILSLRRSDTVFLQNPIFSTYFIALICLVKIIFRPKYIFDFDDATWVQNPVAPKVVASFSDKFIVASHHLSKWKYIRNKPVMVMPNLVDYELAEKYKVNKAKDNDNAVLGWIGSGPLSMDNLDILIPVFCELVKRGVKFTFKLVGTLNDRYPEKSKELMNKFTILGIKSEFVDNLDWGKEGEIQKANSSFDIGLCPLVDNESNRARCSLKVLDYMAAGIPTVISPVGENVFFVEDGKSGFLPKTTDEWVLDLEKLITDINLRKTVGRAGLDKLKGEYSYQGNIDRYIDFLGLKDDQIFLA